MARSHQIASIGLHVRVELNKQTDTIKGYGLESLKG